MQEGNNQPLPPKLDWNNMKDGIYEKIQSLESEYPNEKNKKQGKRRKRLLFITLFLLALGSLFIIYKKLDYSVTEVVGLGQSENLNPDTIKWENPEDTSAKDYISDAVDSNEYKNHHNGSSATKSPTVAQHFRPSESIQPDLNQPFESQQVTQQDRGEHLGIVSESDDKASDTDVIKTTAEIRFPGLNASTYAVTLLPRNKLIQINSEEESPQVRNSIHPNNAPEKSGIRISDQFILEGGLTWWSEGYGNDKPERAALEQTLTSFQLQGHFQKALPNNFFIMVGLQYQQLESRFKYNSTIQDFPITLMDTIVQIRNNVLTGEQTIIRGDIELLVEADRKIVHYNKTKLLNGSLAIGKSWQYNAFQTDVYLGGALNGVVSNQGKTLYQDMIIDYDGSTNPVFKNQWAAAGILGIRQHYYWNQKISLTAGIQAQHSVVNWGNANEAKFHPTTVSILLGLSYSL